jgi:alcohol/geraniol dehydrogenase (NADP+)
MNSNVHAWAAVAAGAPLTPFDFKFGPLGDEEVEIRVESCGICHSDLSMIDNEWGNSVFPLVAGHEIVGTVTATGGHAKNVNVGDRVGLGWYAGSCMSCRTCMSGRHNLCDDTIKTIVGRHGGFAERTRCHWSWAMKLPEGVDSRRAGPLFCGGITVFAPIMIWGVKPTHRVGVIGIGGLGHLALQFLSKLGCHVTAFSSNPEKAAEVTEFGAHELIDSRDYKAMEKARGSFDFILSTVNVPLEWDAYLRLLAPDGRLHFVGAVLEPIQVGAFDLISGRKSIGGSSIGSPATVMDMLDFCARHAIAPQTEHFPMSSINEALDHLRSGKARYRIILDQD